jgi:hypothetical protein
MPMVALAFLRFRRQGRLPGGRRAGGRRVERPPEKWGSRGGGSGRGLVGFLWGTPDAFVGSCGRAFREFGSWLPGRVRGLARVAGSWGRLWASACWAVGACGRIPGAAGMLSLGKMAPEPCQPASRLRSPPRSASSAASKCPSQSRPASSPSATSPSPHGTNTTAADTSPPLPSPSCWHRPSAMSFGQFAAATDAQPGGLIL